MTAWMNRRQVLATGTAATLVAALPAATQGGSRDAQLRALLAKQYEEHLRLRPEEATWLGIDTGERAGLRSRLSDYRPSGVAAFRELGAKHLRELQRFPDTGLGADGRLEREVAIYRLTSRRALEAFPYHAEGNVVPGPYGVTQLGGTYADAPRFLDALHPVNDRADADAYIARLQGVAAAIESETEHLRRNAAAGIVAPRFVVEQTIALVTKLRDADPAQTPLVRSIATRAGAKGLTGYDAKAQPVFEGPIRSALTRQADVLRSLLPRAGTEAGVGRLRNGEAYYAAALKWHSTSSMSPEEVHRIGLEQVAELNGRIDQILRAQGLNQGSVKERTLAFAKAPGQAFPNTDEGRAAIIAYLNERLGKLKPRLPRAFGRLPKAGYEIRRMPVEIQDGAPGGQAQPASADGSRPGVFYINLRDTADWPRFTLPTLAFHEAAPGHLMEGALTLEAGELPLFRRAWFFTGFGEGWGLYSEQVAEELGMYEDDPTGRIGYLLGYLWRAARLVVDTGLHVRGWSRERAIEYLYENSYNSRPAAQIEVDRYIVMPGQATAYKIGHSTFTRLRAEAERRPGFDVRAFHDFVLGGGNLPLDVLERRVRARFAA
ncbi:MAG TPA: DUF885 family protein [Allosphingosinicella sp.]|nr:DUF885 family protein [Allosphingosinicella sp.]